MDDIKTQIAGRSRGLKASHRYPTIASQPYRDAMSRFAGAVSVATTDGPAGRRGVTVSAAVSVSDNPPTVMICLNHNRPENTMFAENGCFAFNVLCQNHLELARAFAGEGHLAMEDRFALGEWGVLQTGAPILTGARTSLDCTVVDVQSVHTHDIVFGQVVTAGPVGEGEALIYLDRQYRSV
ncbi:MAG: flavin reductase [Salaquimonas sp.]|jgi:flavin reductase (DIM6/NTAB) family NADH-FMN oxidoreductase RutF|nr:flavin reductase [Salaquimonas sp.]